MGALLRSRHLHHHSVYRCLLGDSMNILDKRFKYVPSHKTNLEKTFARVRAEQKVKEEKTREIVRPIKQALK
jgi:sterol desaturase/sphingolipid hydroxylase (fatty acid hydroxylase superfamily)